MNLQQIVPCNIKHQEKTRYGFKIANRKSLRAKTRNNFSLISNILYLRKYTPSTRIVKHYVNIICILPITLSSLFSIVSVPLVLCLFWQISSKKIIPTSRHSQRQACSGMSLKNEQGNQTSSQATFLNGGILSYRFNH